MFKKKFVSFGVLIILIIACVILVATLFIVSSVPAVNNPGSGLGLPGTSGNEDEENANKPVPLVHEWELPIVVSITGTDSATGLAAVWGFDYGIKTVNEMGGIRGLPVRITVRDATSSTTEVTSEIEMLTKDSLVIMGPPTEAAFKAGEQVFFAARMPAIGAATDANNRQAYQPFAISCITDPNKTVESVVATWVRVERFTTVCILYSPSNSERVESLETALSYIGKEIVEKIEIGNEAFDAAGIADRAYALGADAFYIDMNGEDTLRLVTQLRFIAGENVDTLKILCGPLAADKELIDSAKEGDMYGVRVWTTLDPSKDIEKRKAFHEAFEKNVGDPELLGLAIDYYQSAIMLKQAFETLAIIGGQEALVNERETLANWLYNSEIINTDQGDFFVLDGGKIMEAKLFRITERGFQ